MYKFLSRMLFQDRKIQLRILAFTHANVDVQSIAARLSIKILPSTRWFAENKIDLIRHDEFAEFVRSCRVFAHVADRTDVQPALDYECAG